MKSSNNPHLSMIISTVFLLSSCSKDLTHSQSFSKGQMQQMVSDMDEQLIVDCVPPPRVKAHGGGVFLKKGKPLRTTVLDCRNKGGEYTVNAPRKKRLEIWQAKANAGDLEAQTYLGEIYEKGLDTPPDYEFAALWYKKAAGQGSRRAQNNLAFLYEKGLGVAKDPQKAFHWYQKAAGSPEASNTRQLSPDIIQELISLRNEIILKTEQAEHLHQKLDNAQTELNKLNQNGIQLEQSESQRANLQLLNHQYTERLQILTKKINSLQQERQNSSQTQEGQVELAEKIARKTDETEVLKENLRKSQNQLNTIQANMLEMQKGHNRQHTETSNEIKNLNQTITQLKQQLATTQNTIEDDKKKFSSQVWKGVNFGKYHALIIGNNQYKNLSKLRTPVNDAKRLDTILRDKYGFKTKLLLNANRMHIIDALGDFRESLSPQDSLLIFYAGHGTITAARGFWQGIDSRPDRESDWISNIDITEILEQMQARHILVVVDSCYSGALSRGSMQELNPNMQDTEHLSWIKQKLSLISRTAITSGGLEPVPDGSGKHSVFAHAFMSHLETNKSILGARSVFTTIEPRVINRAKNAGASQAPEYARLVAAADENGEFYFKPVIMSVQNQYYQLLSQLWGTQYPSLKL